MRKIKLSFLLQVLLSLFVLILLFFTRNLHMDNIFFRDVVYINDVSASVEDEPERHISLPHSFKNLAPRTAVTLKAQVYLKQDDIIAFKTVYSPAKIYLDDVPVYEFGNPKNYPFFMKDPATEIYLITPHIFDKKVELRMEFLSPISRNSLTIHPPLVGEYKAIFVLFTQKYRFPFLISIVQLVAGIFFTIVAYFINFFEKTVCKMIFYLGIFSFLVGLWGFGECNFTGLIIKNPAILYLLAFIGLFTLIIPLLQFSILAADFTDKRPVYFILNFMTGLNILACILQFSGIVAFSKSMYAFHILVPLALCFLSGYTIYESIRYKNIRAIRFLMPIIILTFSALLEVINYQLKITYKFSSLFQLGTLLFVAVMGATIGLYIQDIMVIKKQNEQLTLEMDLIKTSLDEQKKYNALITGNEELLKRQRHDLRHHLIAIKGLSKDDNEELSEYLNSLIKNIPVSPKQYCENKTINSIISHYGTICDMENIRLETNLIIPENNSQSVNSDLCIIFGNLIENAVEACRRIPENRFISLKGGFHYETLVITMDNSCTEHTAAENGKLRSEKREGFGIGLSSIQSVAKKYGGNAKFKNQGGHFQSSVYIKTDNL